MIHRRSLLPKARAELHVLSYYLVDTIPKYLPIGYDRYVLRTIVPPSLLVGPVSYVTDFVPPPSFFFFCFWFSLSLSNYGWCSVCVCAHGINKRRGAPHVRGPTVLGLRPRNATEEPLTRARPCTVSIQRSPLQAARNRPPISRSSPGWLVLFVLAEYVVEPLTTHRELERKLLPHFVHLVAHY